MMIAMAGRWTEFDAVLTPLEWGRSVYTVVVLPEDLVTNARDQGTHRIEGWVEDEPVNVAIARAEVLPEAFFYAGKPLQRRLGLRAGEAVRCRFRPVDPGVVPVADDVRAALSAADALGAFESRTPPERRRLLTPVEAAATAPTRAKRIEALVRELG